MNNKEIFVGVDGSTGSHDAVRWAAAEAGRTGAALRVVHAYEWAWHGARFVSNPPAELAARESANRVVQQALAVAASAAPAVTVTGTAERGHAAEMLLDTAPRASLLVVGHRGGGGFANLLLGSVGQQVAAHARCPVVVVRGRWDAADGPVVIGVDGSPSSDYAMDLALQAATSRGVGLVAVRAYQQPSPPWGVGVPPLVIEPQQLEAQEREALNASLAGWQEKYPTVRVEPLLAQGSPAEVLIGVSKKAQLMVVGSRGHGGFAGLVLGSVGQQLLSHADCPVLIAHARAED